MKINEYIGIFEAADILGVHPGTLRGWANKGLIECHRNPINPRSKRMFKREDLDDLLKKIRGW